jgi:hypothetical protein
LHPLHLAERWGPQVMLRRALLPVMTLLAVGTTARAQNRYRDGYREPVPHTRQDSVDTFIGDALTVLQGDDTVEFFSPHLVAMTADAIREIRASWRAWVEGRPGGDFGPSSSGPSSSSAPQRH